METDKKNIEYPYLPEGKSILYVPSSNPFMQEAKKTAWKESTDRRFSTGAVIVSVKNNFVVSKDANKAPLTNESLINLHKKYCFRRILKIPSGQKYWVCPGCAAGDHHAEYRASKKLIKDGFDKDDQFDLYLFGHWWACKDCWGKMLEIPIRNVYLLERSEILFNEKIEGNIIGHQFDDYLKIN
jgi:deoxycytidylate deaminase